MSAAEAIVTQIQSHSRNTSLASDILLQIERTPALEQRKRRRRETSVAAIESTEDTGNQAPILSGIVRIRPNVSMHDHLARLVFTLGWCDMYEQGRWFGVKKFIDCYFSLVFKPYLGQAYNLNVIHVAKMRKVCAVCNVSPSDRLCTILVMLNYPLWDRLLQVSASLPERYFRRSVRQRLILGERETSTTVDDVVAGTTDAYRTSVAALCLIDRLEFSMLADLNNAQLGHVVGLSQFIANSYDAKQVFRTELVFE